MITSNDGRILSSSEMEFLLFTFIRGSHDSVTATLEFFLEQHDGIKERVSSVNHIFHELRHFIRTQAQKDLLQSILNTHKDKMSLELQVILKREIASAYNLKSDSIQNQFPEWVKENNGSEVLKVNFVLVLVIAVFGTFKWI